jgi:hypothetical protein
LSNHHVGGYVVEDGWRHEVSASVCTNGSFERHGRAAFDAGVCARVCARICVFAAKIIQKLSHYSVFIQ